MARKNSSTRKPQQRKSTPKPVVYEPASDPKFLRMSKVELLADGSKAALNEIERRKRNRAAKRAAAQVSS